MNFHLLWAATDKRPTGERISERAADPHKYSHWSPPRYVRRSVVDPRFDVTLAAVRFLDRGTA